MTISMNVGMSATMSVSVSWSSPDWSLLVEEAANFGQDILSNSALNEVTTNSGHCAEGVQHLKAKGYLDCKAALQLKR